MTSAPRGITTPRPTSIETIERSITRARVDRGWNALHVASVEVGRKGGTRQSGVRWCDVNSQRFDRVTRNLGASLSRRGVFRWLGASLITTGSSWLSRKRTNAQGGPTPAICTQDADCLDADLDPCTGSACVEGACSYFIVDCIPGHVCCGNGRCCPGSETGSCLADSDCLRDSADPCEGFHCEGGACVPFLVFCAPGFACCGNGVCCPFAGECSSDTDCAALSVSTAATLRCISGVCVPTSASI